MQAGWEELGLSQQGARGASGGGPRAGATNGLQKPSTGEQVPAHRDISLMASLPVSLMKKLKLGEGKDVPVSHSWMQRTHACRGSFQLARACEVSIPSVALEPGVETGSEQSPHLWQLL